MNYNSERGPVWASVVLTIAGAACTAAMIWLLIETTYY